MFTRLFHMCAAALFAYAAGGIVAGSCEGRR